MRQRSERYEVVEAEPDAEGNVLCPRQECGKMVGAWTPGAADFFCRHCSIVVRVPASTCLLAIQSPGMKARLENLGKRQLLQLYLTSDLRAESNRAKALELIQALPDD